MRQFKINVIKIDSVTDKMLHCSALNIKGQWVPFDVPQGQVELIVSEDIVKAYGLRFAATLIH